MWADNTLITELTIGYDPESVKIVDDDCLLAEG